MTSRRLRIAVLPHGWFDRQQYRPRLRRADEDRWFLETPAVDLLGETPDPPSGRTPSCELSARPGERREAFAATYRSWNLPLSSAVETSLAAAGDERTCYVVTGQQPGFLTGPLYTVYKAISAIALAETVAGAWGRPCVPVFWVAGEDHDIDEIREVRFPGPDGKEVAFRLSHPSGRRPLSSLRVDRDSEAVLEAVASHFQHRPGGAEVARLVDLYRGRNLASGFAAVLNEIFGERGLLLIDPEQLRRLAAPVIRRLLEDPAAAMDRIHEGCRRVEKHGLKPFVPPRFPLFLLRDGLRDHVGWNGEGLRIDGGGPELRQRDTLDLLERSPEAFSSGALLRPLIQEAVLPGSLTVGGPAEAGYFAQLPPLADSLGLDAPRVALRLQATLLDSKGARALNSLGIQAADLALARVPEDLVPLEDKTGILDDARQLEHDARSFAERCRGEPSLKNDARKRLGRSSGKLVEVSARLRERVERELRRSRRESFAAATEIWNQILPHGELQERRWSVFHYLAAHGKGWLDDLLNEVRASPFCRQHRLVFLGEGKP